ncbi:DUF2786 domain-containing protein [Algivirga pacifica]|uniref:DUF2786 domain-containing protein n=1 Tax=Algivirga pacifica TaxID=1162670 RepID=A0ABP9D764_9BACT
MKKKPNNPVIGKIKKLLALSKSTEQHEAALALQRCRELMDKHGIQMDDLQVLDIEEQITEKGMKSRKPNQYSVHLANMIAQLFQCGVYWQTKIQYGLYDDKPIYHVYPVFYGKDPYYSICCYTFDVLYKKLTKARNDYKSNSKAKRARKTAMKDSFALGWVTGVYQNIHHLIPKRVVHSAEETGLVEVDPLEVYIRQKEFDHFNPRKIKRNHRAEGDGYREGVKEQVQKPVGANSSESLKIRSYNS